MRSSRLEDEVRSLQAQLARAQRLATVGAVTAMVAHEFNNILTPVLNYAQMAQQGDAIMREKAIRHALEGSQRATAICQALLDIAKNNHQPIRKVNLTTLVEETLTTMGRDLKKDGITLITKIPAKLTLTLHAVKLKQVLLNLILNARDAVLEKGREKKISISAVRNSDIIRIRVADTGIGIPPENIKQIFEPFFTTKQDNGTGLGLTISKQIVESMQGRLTVRSQQGKGTVFTISLPLRAGRKKKSSHRQD